LAEYERLFGKPPRCKHRDWLWRRCAHEVQVQRLGGLTEVARRRLDELISEIQLPLAPAARTVRTTLKTPKPERGGLAIGTELRKKWRDTEIVARVTSDGIDCGGVLYKTLTACVRNVTGSDWNPKIFFGVTPRRKRS
ncbi:MAG: DUF2924 domain-containing protein, partial [Planctomycetes bacterium]|nr:DUF2924 domain-containing protein [Planctomycetota bacterium]